MNTIQEQWEMYEKLVLSKDASPIQLLETRRAFYAGFEAMLRVQWAIAGNEYSEDAGVAMLEGCYEESRAFARLVTDGKA